MSIQGIHALLGSLISVVVIMNTTAFQSCPGLRSSPTQTESLAKIRHNTVGHVNYHMKAGFGKQSGGFGKKASSKHGQAASQMLKRAGGDIGSAHALMFQQNIEKLKTTQPEAYKQIQEQMQATRNDPNATPTPEVHERLVEATWDTIASFLPVSSKHDDVLNVSIAGKMEKIATACLHETNAKILDVGCGDAAILKFLKSVGGSEKQYTGIDLSGVMIEAAQSRFRKASFAKANFLHWSPDTDPAYDTVLFNGSLQFFADAMAALRAAASLLGPRGRIVIAHAHGAEFVRDERTNNPVTVAATMPSAEWLHDAAHALGLTVVPAEADLDLDAFYLVVLQRT